MRRLFLLAAMLFMTSNAYAAPCAQMIGQISDLDDSTRQALVVECEQKKLEATNAASESLITVTDSEGNISTEKLSEWGKIAQEWARAIGIAAAELNIAVDEFLGTTAGKITAILIIYKIMGSAILGIVIGIPLMIFTWYIAYRLFRFISVSEYIEKEVTTWGNRTKVIQVPRYNGIRDMSENEAASLWFVALLTVVMTVLILFAIVL